MIDATKSALTLHDASKSLWELDQVTLMGRSRARLRDITTRIPAGCTAVVGPSGAGKSSLLNLLVEFERATRGVVRPSPPAREGLPLFWVPQNGGLWPHLTVEEHLRVVAGDDDWRRLLMLFELQDKASDYPDTLSAGEAGRVAVARGLAACAQVLVMDEPLANVDSIRAMKYWDTIREWSAGRSIVFATHSVETVMREAEHVLCVEEGELEYAGPKQSLYDNPPTRELAEMLGPANWFAEPEEAAQWLEGTSPHVRCYRPEQLKVEPQVSSPLRVCSARFGNKIGELELSHPDSQSTRRVVHQLNGKRFQAGDTVVVRVLMLLLLCCCCFLPGCSRASSGPTMVVREVRHWSIPPAGKVIPAPRSVRVAENGDVYVLDNAGRVLVYDEQGTYVRHWEMPAFDVGKPEGICILKDGRIAVTDTHYHRVVFFDPEGNVVSMHGQRGREPGEFIYPVAITQDPDQNYYICEYGDNDRVQKFAVDGTFLLEFGGFGTGPGELQRPSGIVWRSGQVFVADAINNRLQVFTDQGKFVRVVEDHGQLPDLYYPYDMILVTLRPGTVPSEMIPDATPTSDANHDGVALAVVEYGGGRVTLLTMEGSILSRWGEIGFAKGQLTTPWGLALGNHGQLLIADTGNRRIVEVQR